MNHETMTANSTRSRRGRAVTALLLLVTAIPGSPGSAGESATLCRHPISIIEASVFVARTRGIMRVQLFAEDLLLFQDLEPTGQDRITADDLRRGLEQHKAFLLEKITLRDADGNPITGQITDLKPFKIPADGIPTTELMLHSATYELEFPFAAPPEYLTIQQDITDANYIIPSEMILNVHQSGTALNQLEKLPPGGSVTIRFDWDTALSEEASDAEWETWFEKQREKTLGITSYSSVYSFIYIEPVEVRHEILIPLATLKTILPVKHRDPAWVEIDEQEAVRELIRRWLSESAPATINGVSIPPEFARIDLYSLSLSDFAAQAEARRVSMASGRVGIILRYRPEHDSVRDVSLTWNQFYSAMTKIPAVVIAGADRVQRFEFSRFNTPADNTLTWTCPPEELPRPVEPVVAAPQVRPQLFIPLGSLGASVLAAGFLFSKRTAVKWPAMTLLAGLAITLQSTAGVAIEHPWRQPPELPDSESQRVFEALHQGMYQALDFGSEERIYDVLATTVDGPLLEDLYLQLRRSLEVRDQGGAIARIRDIAYDTGNRLPRAETRAAWPALEYRSTWTVAGTVEHWGHVHERQNQFDAVFTIEPRNGHWKITRMDIQGQTQKSAKTTLRKF
jgi:hypothetical protein